MRLKGKVTMVTGSSRGIGFGIAEGFAREGANVVICGSNAESTAKGIENLKAKYPNVDVFGVAINIGDTDSIKAAFKEVVDHYGKLDVLVNNAGIVLTKSILEMTDEDWDKIMMINATGTFKCSREAALYMKDNGGSIINTSSMNGIYGSPYQSAYSASKAAIIGLTKALAKELGPMKIRVNAIAPGMIGTDMVKESVTPEIKARLLAMTPVRRMGEIEDLQGICNLLASDEGSFMTATVTSVDGGLMM